MDRSARREDLAHLPQLTAPVATGAAAAGRDVVSIDVAPLTLAAVTEPRDGARGLAARHLAYAVRATLRALAPAGS